MSYLKPVPNKLAVLIYRISHSFYVRKLYFFSFIIQRLNMMINSIEIHPGAKIGKNLKIAHSTGIVIGKNVIIGKNVTIYSSVVLGVKTPGIPEQPVVEDNVILSTGSKILGGIRIGKNSIIGANAVVICDVKENSLAVGVPARILKTNDI